MATANDRSKAPLPDTAFEPDSMPPETFQIEAPCSLAETRTTDNSSWTNALREPILIRQGSELRVTNSFIDMRGIDGDIIQFQKTGSQRNNTHTMLFQHYTNNDGFNNKTTTYDYMVRQSEPRMLDPGEGYVLGSNPTINCETVALTGSGNNGLQLEVTQGSFGIRPKNFSITNGGSNYDNGDIIKFGGLTGNQDAVARAIVDDNGTIKNVYWEKMTIDGAFANPLPVSIESRFGSGATFSVTTTNTPAMFHSVTGAAGSATRGEGYRRGDQVSLSTTDGSPVSEENRAIYEITQTAIGKRSVETNPYFDQGYNYQESPVYRWGQTFEITEDFTYGKTAGSRTFTADNGEIRTIDPNSLNILDPSLSASSIMRNREDEFAPGVFHTKGTDQEFTLFKPVLYWSNQTSFNNLELEKDNEMFKMTQTAPDSLIRDGQILTYNAFTPFTKGTVFQLYFKLNSTVTSTSALENELTESFSNKYSGIYELTDYNIQTGEASFGNSSVEYVGSPTNYFWSYSLPGFTDTPADPSQLPNADQNVPLILVYKPDNLPDPIENPDIAITTDATSHLSSFGLPTNGVVGKGCRTGMIFRIDPSVLDTNMRFAVRQVDNSFGMIPSTTDFLAPLTNGDLALSGGEKVDAFFVPMPFYRGSNPSKALQVQKKYNAFFVVGEYPSDWDSAGLRNASEVTTTIDDNVEIITPEIYNGLWKNSGLTDFNNPNYKSDTARSSFHSTKAYMSVVDKNKGEISASFTFGSSGVIQPTSASDWLADTSAGGGGYGRNYITIDKAQWDALYSSDPRGSLPNQTYLIVNIGESDELHILTGGNREDTSAGKYYVDILIRDIQDNFTTATRGSADWWNALYSGTFSNPETLLAGTINTPTNYTNPTITLTYMIDPRKWNNLIKCKWGDGSDNNKVATGTIAQTAPMNFFGNNDPNKSTIEKISKSYTYDVTVLDSYSEGGTYYLSNFTGDLAGKPDTEEVNVTYQKDNFTSGYGEWVWADLPTANYSWLGSDYVEPTEITNNKSFSTIPYIHEYFPLLNEKTFNIDKNFAIPSDIAGIWTEQSHELTGAIDMISGNQYVESSDTGLLQNQFVMPIYGSNNAIDSAGLYIKDFKTYKQSGGLEPGHCVGINYVDEDQKWLNQGLVLDLPQDENLLKFYYVYFRTRWTFIRSYDPMKKTSGSPNSAAIPDRTSLITVNIAAGQVGNAGKTALDGSTIGTSPQQLYELGTAGGTTTSDPVRFGDENHYPIRYLTDSGLYPKAKASQYVGTTNASLVYSNEISAFTFEFFHQPFTAPFVEGQGGDTACRVFYGNRPEGIYNQERLGGIFTINYIRPDYPRGVFLFEEIDTFKSTEYPYGIDPYRDISPLGKNFMNKIGFLDPDIGVTNNKIDLSLNKVQYITTDYLGNAESGVDSVDLPETEYLYGSNNVRMNGTTASNIDSSDAILSAVDAPENNAGLFDNNVKYVPAAGNKIPRILKWGSFIFYPYSLNTDTNSFQTDKSNVRFDNASSTYGSIGGLLISNSGRGCGLPNTTGSTFLVDDSSIPRTLNPDCNLYLSFTVATESSLIKASVLPRKLNNGFLVILSNLIKQPTFYMPKAGFVNAISIAPKTFITGDFISAIGQQTMYAKHDFMLSEIQTTIKDTDFNSPSTLGINSTVIYSIVNYNPKPLRQLPTTTQIQDQEMQMINMMKEHQHSIKTNQISPLEQLYSDMQELGLTALAGGKNSGDIIGAVKNQINYHDLPNLSTKERTAFFRTPEGESLLDNIKNVTDLRNMAQDLADAQLDIESPYANADSQRRLRLIQKDIQAQIQKTGELIRKRTPQIFFQPSEPVEYQIPPLTDISSLTKAEIPAKEFYSAIPFRYKNYREYKQQRITQGRRPVSFEEFQNFHYGNVILPPPGSVVPEEFLPDFSEIGRELSGESLARAKLEPFSEAFLAGNPEGVNPESIAAFRDEVERGVADLSTRQKDILTAGGVGIIPTERGRRLTKIVDDPSKGIFTSSVHRELAGRGFYSQEERTAAEARIAEYKRLLKDKGRGRPTLGRKEEKLKLERELRDFVSSLPPAKVETKGQRFPESLQYSMTGDESPEYQEIQRRIAEYEKGGTGGKRSFQNRDYQELITRRDLFERSLAREERGGGGTKPPSRPEGVPVKSLDLENRETGERTRIDFPDIPVETGKKGQFFYRVVRGRGGDYDPLESGFTGGRGGDAQRNRIFGDKTIWAAEDPRGAEVFARENLFNKAGAVKRNYEDLGYTVYKIDAEGLPFARLHNLISSGRTDLIPSTLRTAITQDRVSEEGYKRALHTHTAYQEHMAPKNKELALRGDIPRERITVHQQYKSLPVTEATSELSQEVQQGIRDHYDQILDYEE